MFFAGSISFASSQIIFWNHGLTIIGKLLRQILLVIATNPELLVSRLVGVHVSGPALPSSLWKWLIQNEKKK